jgi:hypothetical protein|tara:strand:+ start:74 stop:295 length:222 start_codon:yes stop_codon:yes gene_type:complete
MVLRVCAGISVFIGFCALPVSLPVALPLIIIGGLIMFVGDTEKDDSETDEAIIADFVKKDQEAKRNNKKKKFK